MWEKMINPSDNKIHADLNKVVNHISPINQPMIIIPYAGKQVVKLLASYIVKDVVNMFSPIGKANLQYELRSMKLVTLFHSVIQSQELQL